MKIKKQDNYIFGELGIKASFFVDGSPQFDVIIDARSGKHWKIWVGLKAINDMLISLEEHTKFGGVSFPDENVAAVATGHDVIVAPKICFFDHGPKETRVKRGKGKRSEILDGLMLIGPVRSEAFLGLFFVQLFVSFVCI